MLNSIVTIICIALIAFILFWFFKKPEKSGQKAQQKNGYQEIRVEVMGGYTPELIVLKKSVPARIVFDRKDPSPCLDQIVFSDFGVHTNLPMGEEYVVEITPEQAGEFGFACGMNMMHGKMIVE
ncbi:Cu2+-exporting ATPase [Streptococcus pneumoniae]|nr:Cu2+-exporting ATPase [Streptococcus pneumoniae]